MHFIQQISLITSLQILYKKYRYIIEWTALNEALIQSTYQFASLLHQWWQAIMEVTGLTIRVQFRVQGHFCMWKGGAKAQTANSVIKWTTCSSCLLRPTRWRPCRFNNLTAHKVVQYTWWVNCYKDAIINILTVTIKQPNVDRHQHKL